MALRREKAWAPAATLALAALAAMVLAAGCGIGPGPAPKEQRWAISYPAPAKVKGPALDRSLVVRRLWAAAGFDSTDMLSAGEGLERRVYPNDTWLAPPSDMLGDLLTRDLAVSGALAEVRSWREAAVSRYQLSGGLDTCLERDGAKGRAAELTVALLLLDSRSASLADAVLLQKTYRISEPIAAPGAAGLAAAVSKAAARLSKDVRSDVIAALAGR